MAELANLTGSSKRWVIELMQRLEKKHFIRTDGGSGAVKWIWQLPPGVLRLGKASPTEVEQRKKTSPGKAKALRAAGSRPKRRRKKTAPSSKPEAEVNVAPPVEKPVEKPSEIPARRRKGPALSIPPAEAAAPDDPAVLATALIPPPPPAPANPMLPAGMMPPPPPATPPGGPAPDNPVVATATVTPAPSRARGGLVARRPNVRAAKIALPPSTAPGDLAAGNLVVPAVTMPPVPSSAAPGGPGAPDKDLRYLLVGLPHIENAGIRIADPIRDFVDRQLSAARQVVDVDRKSVV